MGDDLSAAVVMVIGFRTRSSPARNYAVLEQAFGEERARGLATRVQVLLRELDGIAIDWSKHDLASAGNEARRYMAGRNPELTDEALEAMSWTFTFSLW